MLSPGLYLVATPIGNLADITLRALETLREADVVYAEDTRHTAILLAKYDIRTPCLSCHKFSERAKEAEILSRVRAGEKVALVTDAGMPGISDPGGRLAEAARAAGLPVTAVPGPCALVAALALLGWHERAGHRFEGFLDNRTAPRRRRLKELGGEDVPVVFYESPHRVEKFLTEVAEELGEGRRVFLARELTKQFEETREGTVAELKAWWAAHPRKGEFVLILLPATADAAAGGEV